MTAPPKLYENGPEWVERIPDEFFTVEFLGQSFALQRTIGDAWELDLDWDPEWGFEKTTALKNGVDCPQNVPASVAVDFLRDRIRAHVAEGVRIVGTEWSEGAPRDAVVTRIVNAQRPERDSTTEWEHLAIAGVPVRLPDGGDS